MDPLTQGLLGASLAQCFAKKEKVKTAAICGVLGGMAPDLDIFIRSDVDPLLAIEYHRHFTHSLLFVPMGGLLVALFLYLFARNKDSFKTIYIFTTLGILTHGLLDACTSYGTRLYWPLSNERVGWNIISIVDPIFTGTLLIFVVLSLFKKSAFLMRIGLVLALFYMGLGVIQHNRVKSFVADVAHIRGHEIDRILLNPTVGNNILWRSVYQSGDKYHIDAVYMPLFKKPIIKQGATVDVINKENVFASLGSDSVQREDIRRFAYFSQDYIYIHPIDDKIIGDLRYGTMPYDNKSFWGIKIDEDKPQEHAQFMRLRDIGKRNYQEFWQMLRGNLND